MTRLALALSLLANLVLAGWLASTLDSYASLSAWACEHGNGGYECGEE